MFKSFLCEIDVLQGAGRSLHGTTVSLDNLAGKQGLQAEEGKKDLVSQIQICDNPQ